MKRFEIIPTQFEKAVLIRPMVFEDYRGFFKETYRSNELKHLLGHDVEFVQDNVAFTMNRRTIRGLHMDTRVDKLVQVVSGATYHVIVDMNKHSKTYKQWQAFTLTAGNHLMIFVPKGFANGYQTLLNHVVVLYKQTDYYQAETEQQFRWDEPDFCINWPLANPILSKKDAIAKFIEE